MVGFRELEGLGRESDSQKKKTPLFDKQLGGMGQPIPRVIRSVHGDIQEGHDAGMRKRRRHGCMPVQGIGRTCRGLADLMSCSTDSHVSRFAAPRYK